MSNYNRPLFDLLNELPAGVKPHPNIMRRLTIGLDELYSKVRSASFFQSTQQPVSYSTPDGKLDTSGKELPLLIARYKYVEPIAEGTFSEVIRANDTLAANSNSRSVAIKVLNHSCGVLGLRELTILYHLHSICRHTKSCFISVLDTFSFQDHVCLVMECFPYTLMDLFQPSRTIKSESSGVMLKQPRAIRQDMLPVVSRSTSTIGIEALRKLAFTLVKALYIFDQQGIIHADLKPENVFIRPTGPSFVGSSSTPALIAEELLLHGDIKIGDFGNALHIDEVSDYYETFEIQTLTYRAPEVLMQCPFDGAIDMWSLGILLVEVYKQEPLFVVTSKHQLQAAIEQKIGPIVVPTASRPELVEQSTPNSGRIQPGRIPSISGSLHSIQRLLFGAPDDFLTFVAGLLQTDPAKRLTPQVALQHPFLWNMTDMLFAIPPAAGIPAGSRVFRPTSSAEVKTDETVPTSLHQVHQNPPRPTQEIHQEDVQPTTSSRHAKVELQFDSAKLVHKREHTALTAQSSPETANDSDGDSERKKQLKRYQRGRPHNTSGFIHEETRANEPQAQPSQQEQPSRRRGGGTSMPTLATLASPPPGRQRFKPLHINER